jgi:hypothetical protein
MPKVGNKKFPYTAKGMAQAKAAMKTSAYPKSKSKKSTKAKRGY